MQETKTWYKSSIILIGALITLSGALFGIDQLTQQELLKSIESLMNAVIVIVNTVGGLAIMYRRWKAENKPIK